MENIREAASYKGTNADFNPGNAESASDLHKLNIFTEFDPETEPAEFDPEIKNPNLIREISPFDKEFPERLRYIPNSPGVLYVKGSLPPDSMKTVAIIGSRTASEYGLKTAYIFARELSKYDVGIISGMAYGIDSEAHKGSLSISAKTYAVMGNGLDICYPPSNFLLSEQILKANGGLISEYPPGSPSLKRHFSERNRIISGLSDAVLVMEARERSGTSITVGHALDQGKPVFCLPGRINDPLSKGCNHFISQGAEILTKLEDILLSLNINPKGETHEEKYMLTKKERLVYKALMEESVHIEELLRKTSLSIQDLSESLMSLELKGLSEMPKNGYYRKR